MRWILTVCCLSASVSAATAGGYGVSFSGYAGAPQALSYNALPAAPPCNAGLMGYGVGACGSAALAGYAAPPLAAPAVGYGVNFSAGAYPAGFAGYGAGYGVGYNAGFNRFGAGYGYSAGFNRFGGVYGAGVSFHSRSRVGLFGHHRSRTTFFFR